MSPDHLLRSMVDAILSDLSPTCAHLHSCVGQPSIAPAELLRALLLLLQIGHTVRCERLMMEQLGDNPLFWQSVGPEMDDLVWDGTVFTKGRHRLREGDVAQAFLARVVAQACVRGWLSDGHFAVDGTVIGPREFRAQTRAAAGADGSGSRGVKSGGGGERPRR